MRAFRTVSGIGFVFYGLYSHQYLLAFLGSFVLLQGIFNIGCCGVSCSTPTSFKKEEKEITYEEVYRK